MIRIVVMKVIDRKVGKKDAFVRIYTHHVFKEEDYSSDMTFPEKKRAILVIPGGGYSTVSEREAEPVAFSFFSKGYEAAILYYSVADDIKASNPIEEASEALCALRALKTVDQRCVSAIGFSAGGHLAAMLAKLGESYSRESHLDALILSYPVITMGKYTHQGSRDNILSGIFNRQTLYSAEKALTPSFPPTFIWSTRDDKTVDVRNSLMMYSSLVECGVYSELHIYPEGLHGLSIATEETGRVNKYVSSWLDEALKFLDSVFSRNE